MRHVEIAVDVGGSRWRSNLYLPGSGGPRGSPTRRSRSGRVRTSPGPRDRAAGFGRASAGPTAPATPAISPATAATPAAPPKPVLDRVRSDGPLLPSLTLALARWIATHYLAPPALVLRAMLPPGMLERLELVAELAPGREERQAETDGADATRIRPARAAAPMDPAAQDLLEQLASGPRPVRELAGPDGRAGLLRRLRAMADRGDVALEWVLTGAGAGPRYERWIRLRPDGRAPWRR